MTPLFSLMLVVLIFAPGTKQQVSRMTIAHGLTWDQCIALRHDFDGRIASPINLGSVEIRSLADCMFRGEYQSEKD